jgi:hypothetical protein
MTGDEHHWPGIRERSARIHDGFAAVPSSRGAVGSETPALRGRVVRALRQRPARRLPKLFTNARMVTRTRKR